MSCYICLQINAVLLSSIYEAEKAKRSKGPRRAFSNESLDALLIRDVDSFCSVICYMVSNLVLNLEGTEGQKIPCSRCTRFCGLSTKTSRGRTGP